MIASNVKLGEGVVIFQPDLVNLYGCQVGDGTRIGPFVEVQSDVSIGHKCKISSHSFLCSGVVLEDFVFIGHGVMFINDTYPRAANDDGTLQTAEDWACLQTTVGRHASIGSNATILGGISIGEHTLIGAGAVVNRDIPAYAIAAGVPARIIGDTRTHRSSAAQNAAD
jgi:acetyltransferase-like isoleucine patch superfamily enzyme